MQIIKTSLPTVLLVEPEIFGDERGFFVETWQKKSFEKAGIQLSFVQDNHSRSTKGVLRGLHFQLKHPQGKLVRVSRGSVFDVAVDVRTGSPTFGQWFGAELSAENHHQLWVPPGFAHGFCVLSDVADFHYKCTDYYCSDCEGGIAWNDPGINIDWPIIVPPSLSAKDQSYLPLADTPVSGLPVYEL
jgi:dTDP-4-dehydrorhamnose 3,5-epimerase